jgi:hypothetical protein
VGTSRRSCLLKSSFFVKLCLHDASWLAQVKCEECARRRFMQVQ